MGYWLQTCTISNLPIKYEDKIIIFPLMLIKPNINEFTYNINDKYCPFSIPIIGRYNDYGGIENVENEKEVISFLKTLKFFIKNEDDFDEIEFYTSEEFFDTILEQNLYIQINENKYKISYMMIHYDLYLDLLNEISFRKVNNINYRSLISEKIYNKVKIIRNNPKSNKTKEQILSELSNLTKDMFDNLTEEQKNSIYNDLLSIFCSLKIQKNHLTSFIYDKLIEIYIENDDTIIFNYILDMLMFEKALELSRKGYLVTTGLGHQGIELKLHLIISKFVDNYISNYIEKQKENNLTDEEIKDTLKEEIFINKYMF